MKTQTLIAAWKRTVAAAPDRVAVIEAETERSTTCGELDALAEAWRVEHGDGIRGRVVVLAEPNGRDWLSVFIGIVAAGGIVAALDPGEPAESQREIARAIRASFLWHNGRLLPVERGKIFHDGRRVVKLTSGSTGAPRALAFNDAQMLADGASVCAAMGITAADRNFALIPFGHSYGLGNLVVPLLAQGTAIVCGSTPLPHAIAAEIAQWRPTVFPTVPAVIAALAKSDVAPATWQNLRTVISAGAPLSAEIAQGFYARTGRKVQGFYGSSETGGITFDRGGEATLEGRSVGTPLPGVTLKFGRGRRFSVEGPAVLSRGKTAGRRTADLGELNAPGELVLLGRTASLVKIGGRRLSLAEVERALRKLPGVKDAFVTLAAERSGQLVAAVATGRPTEELRNELRDVLAPWKIPRRIRALGEFPVTARGKRDTRRLKEWLLGEA